MTLKRGCFFTDIHFGKKSNSTQHNEDCLRFIDWFCDYVKKDGKIDYIGFLGDWNENRSSLNIATLNYSYQGAKKLNDLGLPCYFVVGNHDLYHRNSREIHSAVHFQEFDNFIVIDQPKVIDEVEGKMLMVPYMFEEEYPQLTNYINVPFWAGHFEFKGFELNVYGQKMLTGADHTNFKGPKYIVSGHFHKRQWNDNVVYMGNAFPMDFSDAADKNRGLMIYDHVKQEMDFEDWADCPVYIKTTLSSLLDKSVTLVPEARVKVSIDIPISFEESNYLRKTFSEGYNLREFVMEDAIEIQQAITDTDSSVIADNELSSIDELVHLMLKEIESDHIDSQKLIDIYTKLEI